MRDQSACINAKVRRSYNTKSAKLTKPTKAARRQDSA